MHNGTDSNVCQACLSWAHIFFLRAAFFLGVFFGDKLLLLLLSLVSDSLSLPPSNSPSGKALKGLLAARIVYSSPSYMMSHVKLCKKWHNNTKIKNKGAYKKESQVPLPYLVHCKLTGAILFKCGRIHINVVIIVFIISVAWNECVVVMVPRHH